MSFQQVSIAGDNLVRDAIRSPNYVPAQSGWTVNRDGTAEFSNVTVRGTIVATDFRSANYVPATSGFDLNAATGTAEFNGNININQGDFVAGVIGAGPAVQITTNPTFGELALYSGVAGETIPAEVFGESSGSAGALGLTSPSTGNGRIQAALFSGTPTAKPQLVVGTVDPANGGGVFSTNFDVEMRANSVVPLTTTYTPFRVGDPTTTNVAVDMTGVQALNNGAVSTLTLQRLGGNVISPGSFISGSTTGANVNINFNQVWALNNGAPATLFLNFSSSNPVQVGDGTAAGAGIQSTRMNAQYGQGGNLTTAATPFGPGTVIAGSPTITMTAPPSGIVVVSFAANVAFNLAGGELLALLEIRQNNGAGALLYSSPAMVMQPDGANTQHTGSRIIVATGLTGTLFLQLTYQGAGTAGAVGTIRIPTIAVLPSM